MTISRRGLFRLGAGAAAGLALGQGFLTSTSGAVRNTKAPSTTYARVPWVDPQSYQRLRQSEEEFARIADEMLASAAAYRRDMDALTDGQWLADTSGVVVNVQVGADTVVLVPSTRKEA